MYSIALCNTCVLCSSFPRIPLLRCRVQHLSKRVVFFPRHFSSLQTASVLLPITLRLLAESDWSLRESGVLLLGIIALQQDPSGKVAKHWPHVLPALCRGLDDGHASLRAISCWAATHCLYFAMECGVRAVLSSSLPPFPFLLIRVFGFAVLCFAVFFRVGRFCFGFHLLCCVVRRCDMCCACCIVLCCAVLCCVVRIFHQVIINAYGAPSGQRHGIHCAILALFLSSAQGRRWCRRRLRAGMVPTRQLARVSKEVRDSGRSCVCVL